MTDTWPQGLTVHLPYASPEEFLQRYGAQLTRGGIYLRAKALKAPGTAVVLDLRLAGGARLLHASAVVSWVTGVHGAGVLGMGFKFIALDAASRRFLESAAAVMPHAQAEEPPLPTEAGAFDANPDALAPRSSPSQSQPRLPSEDSGQLAVHGDVSEVRAPAFEAAPEPGREGPIIGIDLGTCNARAAVVSEGGVPTVLRREAQAEIPAVVALSARGRFLVGTAARAQLATNPRWAVSGVKRLIGRDPSAADMGDALRRVAFEVLRSPEGTCAVRLADRTYRVEELCALILREVKTLAEERLKTPVHRAVIGVPAWFAEVQRKALEEAGRLAGLSIAEVVSEACAAAQAVARGRERPPSRVLVYDLGGGSFEASLVELRDGEYQVVASGGDTFLGGSDFDAAVAAWALSEFEKKTGASLTDRVAVQRVYEAAERAKIALSDKPEARMLVSLVTVANQRPLDLDLTLTRAQLDKLTRQLVDRTMEVCQELMRGRSLLADQIDEVIVAGGQSHSAMVQERLTLMFGKKPIAPGNPEDAVALGVALAAEAVRAREAAPPIDRLPASIGVGLPGGRFQVVIPQGTRLPAKRTYVLSTTKDNQPAFQLMVFQGEAGKAAENTYLGTFKVDKLAPAPRGAVTIELTFELDASCLLTIVAKEAGAARDVSAHYATRDTPTSVRTRLKALDTDGPGSLTPQATGVFGWVKKLLRT